MEILIDIAIGLGIGFLIGGLSVIAVIYFADDDPPDLPYT